MNEFTKCGIISDYLGWDDEYEVGVIYKYISPYSIYDLFSDELMSLTSSPYRLLNKDNYHGEVCAMPLTYQQHEINLDIIRLKQECYSKRRILEFVSICM